MQSHHSSFPMWAARAAAEQAERRARQRLNKMIQDKFNSDDGRGDEHPEQSAVRFDELLRRFFVDNLLPLLIWFVELIVCVVILAILSVASYVALYRWVIMRGLEVQSRPIFFDYNPTGIIQQRKSSHLLPPIGRVDLRSSKRAPWAYSCSSTSDDFCVIDDDRIIMHNNAIHNKDDSDGSNDNECKGTTDDLCTNSNNEAAKTECKEEDNHHPILLPDQRYFFEVTLTLPESEINKQLGVFMLTVDLRSSDKQLLASSKQSSMLPFESNMIAIFRKFALLFPLSAGLLAETRTITLLSFDNYVDVSDKRSLSYVEVTLGVPNPASFSSSLQSIQIQSSKLRYGKEMSPIQEFFRSMRWPCAFLGTTFFFIVYVYAALTIWRRRTARIRWNAQPYADLFSDDGGSAPNNSKTRSDDRWMDADIEILEEECNDSDKWEPLNETNHSPKKKEPADQIVSDEEEDSSTKKEPADQIVSDEEESVSSVDPNAEVGTAKVHDTDKSSFPFGKLASFDEVKGRPNVLGQKPSREDEEKSLADMVMKGQSKYAIFTGERRPV